MNHTFIECFNSLTDPRVDRTKKHLLLDIIAIAISGILSGAESWEELEDFAKAHQDWFSQFLILPNGIPSHDTISRVFSALNPSSFQTCCLDWLKRIKTLLPERVIAVDGKALRGSRRVKSCQKALHIINAWSCVNQVCLGQLKVEDKSNEIPAVPELLKLLYLEGAIVTMDAMGAQKSTIQQIIDAKADYVVALKGNQGNLHESVVDSFKWQDKEPNSLRCYQAEDALSADHGKIECRNIDVMDTEQLSRLIAPDWEQLNSVARVTYTRLETGKTVTEQRFYISSLPASKPQALLKTIRSHWQVENSLHWNLDVTFKEDACRIRNENAAVNLSWLRKFGLSLLKNEPTFKASLRRKQRKACNELAYLARVIKAN